MSLQRKEEDVTKDGLARPRSDLVVERCVRRKDWRYLTGYYNNTLDNPVPAIANHISHTNVCHEALLRDNTP